MTRDDILSSGKLKEQFLLDYGIPITVTDNPFFLQRLIELDPIYHGREAFKSFCKDMLEFKDEEQYLRERSCSLEACLARLKSGTSLLCRLCLQEDNLWPLLGAAVPIPQQNESGFYNQENLGRTFARIRLKHGAFSAVNHFYPGIFQFASPQEFIRSGTSHFCDSRIFHEKLLDFLGMGRVNQLVLITMSIAAHYLEKAMDIKPSTYIESGLLYELPFDALLNDEAIGQFKERIESALISMPDGFGKCFVCEIFRLESIEPYGFLEQLKSSCRFIGVDPNYCHILATYYFRQPLLYDDYIINYHGRLVKLLEPIENPF